MPVFQRLALASILGVVTLPSLGQQATPPSGVELPRVTVTADAYTESHGGYLVSGDFRTDPRMPGVVFPATALVEGDVLSIEPQYLNGNDYVVLQECASDDCSTSRIVRVWSSVEGHPIGGRNDRRILIPHENKYWIWAKRLPEISHPDCDTCATHFTSFVRLGPPMTITPNGEEVRYHRSELEAAASADPLPVTKQEHEGSTFVITFAGGSTVRIRRMHAAAP
ncbi:hypothetical protein BJI69_04895 [Luteibacter rhizovicinus DSM 16549]|uniref:Uncharacterized protein n=1 Tax=Luteibacter rhizovicinus DSM 16549 TaxID=1440763 RepID=A0A0G9HDC4_9GAMM|nr:hypothetical protein [Luteibacter rhizovicinus]APG03311.1 hypothetical protein BJI69_04895 [Luteibacter rhizovicinus DSM 16549]KLD67745.1 hypothetical protein Y883_06165 [Luteibacter rhizovicinus DSM 16549]KLD79421.1 hypothetical protein Y886_04875 [Xanthomonas hyacinthi DSM 19077]